MKNLKEELLFQKKNKLFKIKISKDTNYLKKDKQVSYY